MFFEISHGVAVIFAHSLDRDLNHLGLLPSPLKAHTAAKTLGHCAIRPWEIQLDGLFPARPILFGASSERWWTVHGSSSHASQGERFKSDSLRTPPLGPL